MPTYTPIAKDVEATAEKLQQEMAKAGHPWRKLLFYCLRSTDHNIRDLYRKFWQLSERISGGAVGGGIPSQAPAPPKIPLCTITFESERIGRIQKKDGTQVFQPMAPVVWPLWDREPVRQLYGFSSSHVPTSIDGSLWIETLDGGLTEKRYYINMRPSTAVSPFIPGSLIGFNIGFGRYGSERLQFRLDMYEYQRSSGAEIATIEGEEHSSSKWQTYEGASPTSGLITDAILATYQSSGLRIKFTLTVWGW